MENAGHSFGKERTPDIYLANIGETALDAAENIAAKLRAEGIFAETDLMGKGLKAQMKYADKVKARFSAVIGDDEVKNKKLILRNMENGETNDVAFDDIAKIIKGEM